MTNNNGVPGQGDPEFTYLANHPEEINWDDIIQEIEQDNILLDNIQQAITKWLNQPADPPMQHVTNGAALFGMYMTVLAQAVGWTDEATIAQRSPELHALYTELITGLLAQGVMIGKGETRVVSSPGIVEYLETNRDDPTN